MTGVCLFLVCFACICIQAQIFNEGVIFGTTNTESLDIHPNHYLSDYPPFYPPDNEQDAGYVKHQKPEVIRQQSGTDMILKCNTTSCLYHKHKIIWEFKACQPDFKKIPCTTLYESNNKAYIEKNSTWDKVSGNVVRKKCAFNLQLQNTNESHSGLYRCTDDNKIIKTYEVEVIDSVSRYSGQPPELLDVIPSNITINQNMQVIIQCKVYSKQPPAIWWFKQNDGTNYDIQYSDKFYSRINTSDQVYAVPHELNVYLSKLNIYHAREIDSGVYVCVAMTESGKDLKDAVVNVITTANYWEPHTSFFLLFLIPVAFALIPITVWLCYFRKKKRTVKKTYIQNHQDRNLIRPFISDRTVVNGSTVV